MKVGKELSSLFPKDLLLCLADFATAVKCSQTPVKRNKDKEERVGGSVVEMENRVRTYTTHTSRYKLTELKLQCQDQR